MGVSAVVTALAGRRAIVAKLGMDAHWRGAIVVASALRDAGMDVTYLGHTTAAELVATVNREDPALVGLSTLSGNHLEESAAVMDAFREAGIDGVAVVVGGVVPPCDRDRLLAMGVHGVFPTGFPLQQAVRDIAALLEAGVASGS